MILRTNRGALMLVALLGFAVGLAVSLRVDFQKSEAINLFGGAEKPAAPVPTGSQIPRLQAPPGHCPHSPPQPSGPHSRPAHAGAQAHSPLGLHASPGAHSPQLPPQPLSPHSLPPQ